MISPMIDLGFRHTSLTAARLISSGLRRVSRRRAERRSAPARRADTR
ncbi:hypothetical protein BZZ08_05660 [Streptomyces sp. MH60]|nr:hypothetical protein BZZ08_05660 [Streptomyces sp. MH60]